MKMIQTEYVDGRPDYELFYDGEIPVDYSGGNFGTIEVSLQERRDTLLMRGYIDYEETPQTKSRKKVTNE